MTKRGNHDEEETTRSKLARTVLWLLGVIAIGLLILFALEQKLGLSRDAVAASRGIFSALFGLTAMAFVFYFRRGK